MAPIGRVGLRSRLDWFECGSGRLFFVNQCADKLVALGVEMRPWGSGRRRHA